MPKQRKKGPSGTSDIASTREELLQVFKRGAQFTEDLLKENNSLRFRVAELELRSTGKDDDVLIKELVEKVRRLEEERDRALQRFHVVEAANLSAASRYDEVEAENNKLLNLYIASYQLHSTLDFDEVLQIITEIVLNFLGSDTFAVALLDDRTKELVPVLAENVDRDAVRRVDRESPRLKDVLRRGEAYFADDINGRSDNLNEPRAIVPLRIKDQVIGLMLLYAFLPQKQELSTVDHELFALLGGHAASAIFAAKLFTDAAKKTRLPQGLVGLVTS